MLLKVQIKQNLQCKGKNELKDEINVVIIIWNSDFVVLPTLKYVKIWLNLQKIPNSACLYLIFWQ